MRPIFLRSLALFAFFLLCKFSFAQSNFSGTVTDKNSKEPLEGATIRLFPQNTSVVTNEAGHFSFGVIKKAIDSIVVASIGYETKIIATDELKKNRLIIELLPQSVELSTVVLSGNAGSQYRTISKTDIAMRGVNNSQEILRIIPGMVIGQHQGGGKAEQIFLRGFDADHGTDFRMEVDGFPINMVSHAHGQGFADAHFIIPEIVSDVDFKKGMYAADKGDFATTGFVNFNTKNVLENNVVKVEAGMFHTYRALAMLNLLGEKAKEKQQSWYVASEYNYSDGFFEHPQHFNRFNFFTKFNSQLSKRNHLTLSATNLWSKWDASGQIPDRAVEEKLVGFYGALDPNEGGLTYRTNVNAQLRTSFSNGDFLKNQLYYSNYFFDLHSNFTFFLEDPVNGDEIRQKERRNMLGYNGSYHHYGYLNNGLKYSLEAGLNVRADLTTNTELSHTRDRYTTLETLKLGDISQWNVAPYVSSGITFNEHFSVNAGLRFDQFFHQYNNKLTDDATLSGIGIYRAKANTLSPKLDLSYRVNNSLQFYVSGGKGFHSNDTRVVVAEKGMEILPSAYGADLGTVFKPVKNVLINVAIWYSKLQKEFVYGGDGGTVEFNGKTERKGFDFSARFEPVKSLYFDCDVNYSHGRAVDEPKGENYIPLAPIWTSSGGITYACKSGFNGSFRYCYIGDRPANEDYSLTAKGYFITDAVVNFTKAKYEIGMVVNNVFNTRWKETQFATLTRLKGEAQPVDEICFTPGTPLGVKLSFSIRF